MLVHDELPVPVVSIFAYEDIMAILKDPDAWSSVFLAPSELEARADLPRSMLAQDPPEHTRLRGLVSQAFTPRMIQKLRPRVESLVDGLLGAVMTRGQRRMDVIRDLATPLPVIVIAELLGVPINDQGRLKVWSDNIAVVLDGSVRGAGLPAAADSAGELAGLIS